MTNIFIKSRHKGAATLIITLILLVLSSLIIIFAANFGVMHIKTIANLQQNSEAFEAAEAGVEYGINYLKTNKTIILSNPLNGLINFVSNLLTNILLPNNSSFSIIYTNATPNDYSVITITSTGKSSDGTVTKVISQQVKLGSILLTPGQTSVVSQGQITMSGLATVTNLEFNSTLQSGQSVSISGAAKTLLSGGIGSIFNNLGVDVQSNNASLTNMSQNDFFESVFGNSPSVIKNQIAHVYSNSADTNYSSTLNGMTGTSIWIDQTGGSATLNGLTTIGSLLSPVLLIVNGNLKISGTLTIFGYVFVFGNNDIDALLGNVTVVGGIASSAGLKMAGNISISYSSSILGQIQTNPSLLYYAKVPGSWKDF